MNKDAAAIVEACAQACESVASRYGGERELVGYQCAAAVRALGVSAERAADAMRFFGEAAAPLAPPADDSERK